MAGDLTLRLDASDLLAVLAEIQEIGTERLTAHQSWQLNRMRDGKVRAFAMGKPIVKGDECVLPVHASDELVALAHDMAVSRD